MYTTNKTDSCWIDTFDLLLRYLLLPYQVCIFCGYLIARTHRRVAECSIPLVLSSDPVFKDCPWENGKNEWITSTEATRRRESSSFDECETYHTGRIILAHFATQRFINHHHCIRSNNRSYSLDKECPSETSSPICHSPRWNSLFSMGGISLDTVTASTAGQLASCRPAFRSPSSINFGDHVLGNIEYGSLLVSYSSIGNWSWRFGYSLEICSRWNCQLVSWDSLLESRGWWWWLRWWGCNNDNRWATTTTRTTQAKYYSILMQGSMDDVFLEFVEW